MAVEIAVDTNRYRDFVDGNPEAAGVFRSAAMIHLPLIVLGELRPVLPLVLAERRMKRYSISSLTVPE